MIATIISILGTIALAIGGGVASLRPPERDTVEHWRFIGFFVVAGLVTAGVQGYSAYDSDRSQQQIADALGIKPGATGGSIQDQILDRLSKPQVTITPRTSEIAPTGEYLISWFVEIRSAFLPDSITCEAASPRITSLSVRPTTQGMIESQSKQSEVGHAMVRFGHPSGRYIFVASSSAADSPVLRCEAENN